MSAVIAGDYYTKSVNETLKSVLREFDECMDNQLRKLKTLVKGNEKTCRGCHWMEEVRGGKCRLFHIRSGKACTYFIKGRRGEVVWQCAEKLR